MITGSGIMTIFFYKGLARNPKIGNTPVWILPNIWRQGKVMDTKFSAGVPNRMILNAATFQGYSSYCFWVIKRKPTGVGGVKLPPTTLPPPTHTPRLGLRTVVVTKLLASGILFWTSLIFLFTTVVVTKSMVSGIILSTSLL